MANFVSTLFNSGEAFEEFLNKVAKSIGLLLTYDTSSGNIYLKNEKEEILGTVRFSELLTTAITAEANRAKTAEQANATAISNEATRAQAAESALNKAITDEVTRAKAAEQANATAITNLNTWKTEFSNFTKVTVNSDKKLSLTAEAGRIYIFAVVSPSDTSLVDTVVIFIHDLKKDIRSTRSTNGYSCSYNGSTTKSFLIGKEGEYITPSSVYVRVI